MWRIPLRVEHHNTNQLISALRIFFSFTPNLWLGHWMWFWTGWGECSSLPSEGPHGNSKTSRTATEYIQPQVGTKKMGIIGKIPNQHSRPTLAKFITFLSWPSSSSPSSLTEWMIDWWRCNPKELPFFGDWQDIISLTTFQQFWSKFTIWWHDNRFEVNWHPKPTLVLRWISKFFLFGALPSDTLKIKHTKKFERNPF